MHVLTASRSKRLDIYLALLIGVVVSLTWYFVSNVNNLDRFNYYFLPTVIITLCLGILFCCVENVIEEDL